MAVPALIAGLLFVLSGCREDPSGGGGNTGSSRSTGPRSVVALGRLAPAGDVLEILGLPGARVDKFGSGLVEDEQGQPKLIARPRDEYGVFEGGIVQAGALLVRMETYKLLATQFEAAEAKLKFAGLQHEQQIRMADAQVLQAQAAVAQAQAKLTEIMAQQAKVDALGEAAAVAEKDIKLLTALKRRDDALVTDQQLARQAGQAAIARAEHAAAAEALPAAIAAARQAVATAQANLDMARVNQQSAAALDPTIAAELEVDAARQARDQAEILAPGAPLSGTEFTVLDIAVQPGEFVTQMPIMQIADLSEMVCIAEVYEADAKEIKLDQPVLITSSAFSGDFAGDDKGLRGTVQRIGNMVANPGLTNRNPLAPSDRSVIEVRINIDPDQPGANDQASRLVGMQVTVEFLAKASDAKSGDDATSSTPQASPTE